MNLTYQNPFTAPGVWLKGNLHTHTTVSDGIRSPQEAIDHYSENGYDFLSITDHGTIVDPSSLKHRNLTLIPGEELCLGKSRAGSTYHIVALNIKKSLPLEDFDQNQNPQEALDLTEKQGGFTIIAHPYWSGLTHHDLISLKGYLGIEIYNTTCEVYRGLGNSAAHIDALLAEGKRPLIFASDDHHGAPEPLKPSDACGAWIMVKAKDRTTKSITESIQEGLFYSSNGPTIKNIKVEDMKIYVETEPVKHLTFISTPSLGARFTPRNELITEYTYNGRPGETYVRVEAMDLQGRKAWSNPIYFK